MTIRDKIIAEADVPRETIDEIVKHANYFSPVANSFRNPIAMKVELA